MCFFEARASPHRDVIQNGTEGKSYIQLNWISRATSSLFPLSFSVSTLDCRHRPRSLHFPLPHHRSYSSCKVPPRRRHRRRQKAIHEQAKRHNFSAKKSSRHQNTSTEVRKEACKRLVGYTGIIAKFKTVQRPLP